ncbi:MAG: pentapeptide repeat-containing protein [Candidatus Dadabacteria bacterium]|nr:pentapeptide repeat-containing protein [Candidatus Dadabacteria bacterium]
MSEQEKGIPALPGEPCKVQPHPKWTPQEQWAWKQICEGKRADLSHRSGDKSGSLLDPTNDWIVFPDDRVITPEFLETILLHEPYRSAIPRQGVRIINARFIEILDFTNAQLNHELMLAFCRLEMDVLFGRLKTPHLISLEGSKFNGKLNMSGLQVEGSLFMGGGAEFHEVDLGGAIIGEQLDMEGSQFNKLLNMNGLRVDESLFMRGNAEFNEVDLGSANIGVQLDMNGSEFNEKLNMNGLQVEGSLFMGGGAEFKEVDLQGSVIGYQLDMSGSKFFEDVNLRGANIGGQLSMEGSKFNGELNMNVIFVDGGLIMRFGAEFHEVDIGGADIGGQLDMEGSKFNGKLNMNGLMVKQSVFMRSDENNRAEFLDVDIVGANIGGQLSMTGSKFNAKLIMESIKVGQHLLMSNSTFEFKKGETINLSFAKIESGLNIAGCQGLSSLDLTGSKIQGVFALGEVSKDEFGNEVKVSAEWSEDARLTLRNAEVGAIQDLPNAWPNKLELEGFTYNRLGGWGAEGSYKSLYDNYNESKEKLNTRIAVLEYERTVQIDWAEELRAEVTESDDMSERSANWFKIWLAKDITFSPQPYEQLAKVLRVAGNKDKANKILFASKKRDMIQADWLPLSKLWLILKLFFNYGNTTNISVLFAIFLVFVGAAVFQSTPQFVELNRPFVFSYSIDMLLPFVELNKFYSEIQLSGWQNGYFFIHKFMGWVLTSSSISGIPGITKR